MKKIFLMMALVSCMAISACGAKEKTGESSASVSEETAKEDKKKETTQEEKKEKKEGKKKIRARGVGVYRILEGDGRGKHGRLMGGCGRVCKV